MLVTFSSCINKSNLRKEERVDFGSLFERSSVSHGRAGLVLLPGGSTVAGHTAGTIHLLFGRNRKLRVDRSWLEKPQIPPTVVQFLSKVPNLSKTTALAGGQLQSQSPAEGFLFKLFFG